MSDAPGTWLQCGNAGLPRRHRTASVSESDVKIGLRLLLIGLSLMLIGLRLLLIGLRALLLIGLRALLLIGLRLLLIGLSLSGSKALNDGAKSSIKC